MFTTFVDLGRAPGARPGSTQGGTGATQDPGARQRDRDDQQGDVFLEPGESGQAALHPARQADPECLRGVFQWPIPGRLSEPALVSRSRRCPAHRRGVADPLQHNSPTQRTRLLTVSGPILPSIYPV
jgi:hypothetical protein